MPADGASRGGGGAQLPAGSPLRAPHVRRHGAGPGEWSAKIQDEPAGGERSQGGCHVEVRVRGGEDPETPCRFHVFRKTSPARYEGWVGPKSPELYQLSAAYLEPFAVWAARFGLNVQHVHGEGPPS